MKSALTCLLGLDAKKLAFYIRQCLCVYNLSWAVAGFFWSKLYKLKQQIKVRPMPICTNKLEGLLYMG